MPFTEFFSSTSLALVGVVGAVFVFAGAIKGVVGFGLPTVSMALLALVMAPVEAAALLIVPSLVTNAWQTGPFRTLKAVLRRVGAMQLGICFGTFAGAWIFGALSAAWVTAALGLALIVYAIWGLFGSASPICVRTEKWLGPLVGVMTGIVAAATGVFVVPAVPYLQSLGLDRDELIQAMGVSFTVSTVALAVTLTFTGNYSVGVAGASAMMLAPALVGMTLGQYLRRALSPGVFRACFLSGLFILGLHLATRALF